MPVDPLGQSTEPGDAGEHHHDLPHGVVLDQQRRDQPPPLAGGERVRVPPQVQPHLRDRELQDGQHGGDRQDGDGGDRPPPRHALTVVPKVHHRHLHGVSSPHHADRPASAPGLSRADAAVLHSSTVAVGAVLIILASANLRFRPPVARGTG
jgi:hypothetical protein